MNVLNVYEHFQPEPTRNAFVIRIPAARLETFIQVHNVHCSGSEALEER